MMMKKKKTLKGGKYFDEMRKKIVSKRKHTDL